MLQDNNLEKCIYGNLSIREQNLSYITNKVAENASIFMDIS